MLHFFHDFSSYRCCCYKTRTTRVSFSYVFKKVHNLFYTSFVLMFLFPDNGKKETIVNGEWHCCIDGVHRFSFKRAMSCSFFSSLILKLLFEDFEAGFILFFCFCYFYFSLNTFLENIFEINQ